MAKDLPEVEKTEIAQEIARIATFHCKALGLNPKKTIMKLAVTMFIEGVKYIPERTKNDK